MQKAKIVFLSAERLAVLEVARRAGVSRPAVWRWQRRYGEQEVDGLLRDKTRKPGKAPLSVKIVAKVLELIPNPRNSGLAGIERSRYRGWGGEVA